MVVNRRYSRTSEPSLASFNWIDFVNKIGYVDFNLASTGNSGAQAFILTTGTQHSNEVFLTAGAGQRVTKTFESSQFVTPLLMEGDMYLDISKYTLSGTGGISFSGALQISGAYAVTDVIDFIGEGKIEGADTWMIAKKIPKTNIKVGDRIRLVTNFAVGASLNDRIGTDPANRALGSFEYTNSKLSIPFKVDI